MSQPHDLPLGGPGRDLEGAGQGLALHDLRMIARCREGVLETGEEAPAPVQHGARRAVQEVRGRCELRAVDLGQSLVSEADAQDGHAAGEPADRFGRHAGSRRIPRPGRQHQALDRTRAQRFGRDGVVRVDLEACTERGQVLQQAADEGAVVVDDPDHREAPVAR